MTDEEREKLESKLSDLEDLLYKADVQIRSIKNEIYEYYKYKPQKEENEKLRGLLRILLNRESHGPHTMQDAVSEAQAILDR
jgi:ppGpp synthetase/RelA/SpoT-type nucleotidyltranferase